MTTIKTRERPILCSGPMVRAILDGSKTQTRRTIKGVDTWPHVSLSGDGSFVAWSQAPGAPYPENGMVKNRYGVRGDRLWGRETWADVNSEAGPSIMYRADNDVRTWQDFSTLCGPDYGAGPSMDYDNYPGDYTMWWRDLMNGEPDHNWKPSIHMPRWASRITLEIDSIGIERLNDITIGDAKAEGVNLESESDPIGSYLLQFQRLWESINGKGSWNVNPWVWVVKFHRVES